MDAIKIKFIYYYYYYYYYYYPQVENDEHKEV